jgi:Leucine-rich repeat (LRR) protein
LPDNFEQLTNLQTLFLTNNQFRALPDSIGKLTALHILDLSSNELSALQKEVIKKLEEKGMHIGTRNAYL